MMVQAARSPVAIPSLLPDPILSANVYCSGRLCEVISHLVAPFWSEYRRSSADGSTYVWMLRYARCGEHLKIRLHAPDRELPLLAQLLRSAQADYFSRLAQLPVHPQRISTPSASPIDSEDRATADYADRTFLWTEYNRSPISLGYRPFLDDDEYSALLTCCLGRGAEIVLSRLRSGGDGKCPYHLQKALWLDVLLTALRATSLSTEDRTSYLLYHRDCLLRYVRKRRRWIEGAPLMERMIARFDQQAERPDSRRGEMARAAAEAWGSSPLEIGACLAAWFDAVHALTLYMASISGDAADRVDPFAELPVFPALFKILHGLANQIGLDPFNEAFLYHLLVDVAGEPDLRGRPVRLRPDL
jgi:hypothetical protein